MNQVNLAGMDLDSLLHPVFQPLVDLDSGAVVGYEALIRGPQDLGLQDPQTLFGLARAQDCVPELDWACRRVAVERARQAGCRHPLALFINAEPEALGGPPGGDVEDWAQMGDLRCFAEITERALSHRPGELLRLADTVRSQDWGIALDDIGANPQTLALMPMLAPDVLKLDLAALHQHDQPEIARLTHAVLTHAAETGATVVAEGIETAQQHDLALALGARLGQGWHLGRPGPLPEPLPMPVAPVGLLPRLFDRAVTPSPYAVVNDRAVARRAPVEATRAVWAQLVGQAATLQPPPVLLSAFPDRCTFTEYAASLAQLGQTLPMVAAIGATGSLADVPGLRVQRLAADDPADAEWDLVVIGPHYAAALVARPLPEPSGPGRDYEFVLTFSRPLVVLAANAILMRLDAG